MKKILAFSGGNSDKSINQQLVKLAAASIKTDEVTILDLRDYQLPIYSSALEEQGYPEVLLQFKAIFDAHHAYIIASPEHNGMMPAVLKNTFDWLSRMADPKKAPMFANKPVLLLSTSPGPRGGTTNLTNMAQVMPHWGADIKGFHSFGSFYDIFKQGKLVTEQENILNELVLAFHHSL